MAKLKKLKDPKGKNVGLRCRIKCLKLFYAENFARVDILNFIIVGQNSKSYWIQENVYTGNQIIYKIKRSEVVLERKN